MAADPLRHCTAATIQQLHQQWTQQLLLELETKVYRGLMSVYHSVLNVKALVAFNQETALVGAFSVIVKSSRTFA